MASNVDYLYTGGNVKLLTPDDSTDFVERPRAITVGGAGDLVFVNEDDTTTTLAFATSGTAWFLGAQYSLRPKRINATGTTATGIYGIWQMFVGIGITIHWLTTFFLSAVAVAPPHILLEDGSDLLLEDGCLLLLED